MIAKPKRAARLASAVLAVPALAGIVFVSAQGCSKGGASGNVAGSASPAKRTPEEIDDLVKSLSVKNPIGPLGANLWINGAKSLGEVGPPAKDHGAIEALQKHAKDKDPLVRAAVEDSLQKIKGS